MFNESTLYDQDTFYKAFMRDLLHSKDEAVIESPFITEKRMRTLLPIFAKLRSRDVRIVINTRNPTEHDGDYYYQALNAIYELQELGVTVLYTAGHHRKLAILDRKVIYEGSLNILSFNDSCEIMRKIVSEKAAKQLCKFIAIDRYARSK
jgi:phosphatidylserine/phosphatidylglycerophosphate/cardiolipin synthase-like enzyme